MSLVVASRLRVTWVLSCVAIAVPCAAIAQIDEIIVTARKKAESLQDVPISVTAFGTEQLRGLGLQSDSDVADFTVNFNTLSQVGRDLDRPVIRGMSAPPSRGEANAGYFIDGIYVSGSIATATTSAVERVEILRGPQATQFGRATFAGAVNYVTKKPGDYFEGEISTRAGTSEEYAIGGWATGPILGDTLGFLLSASWSQYGGQWHNALQQDQAFGQPWFYNPPGITRQGDESRLGDEETQDYLAKLVWRPWAGGEINVKYGYTEVDDGSFPSLVAPAAAPLAPLAPSDPRWLLADRHGGPVGIFNTLNCWLPPGGAPLPPGAPPPGQPAWWSTSGGATCGELRADRWENRVNLPDFTAGVPIGGRLVGPVEPGLRKNQNRYFIEFQQALDDWQLMARYGANTERFDNVYDLDHTEARSVFGLFNFELDRDNTDWSAELRLASPQDRAWRGEIGGYYFDRRLTSNQRSFIGPEQYFGGTSEWSPRRARRNVENIAWFGALGIDIGENWTLDLEGRYASEEVAYRGGNGCATADTYYNFTPRVSLTWKPTDALRLYAQAANGDKPGDVNTEFFRGDVEQSFCEQAIANTSDVVVRPEEQWTYEAGMKSRWLDERLQVNLAVFLIDWSEQSIFQTQAFGAYVFPGYTNTEDLVTTLLRNVGDSRNIGGELETQFAVTDELTLLANYGFTHARFRRGSDSNLADLTGNGDVDGRTIPYAPEHNVVLGAVLERPLDDVTTFTFRADLAYESRRYITASNFAWLGARTLVNLRTGVRRGPWDVMAYVRNLMDDDTPNSALPFVNFGYGAIAPGPDGAYGGSDDIYPNMLALNPQRGRDLGLEINYRFGAE
ncbi:MAG: TonB-dependent receptor [Gammaproteobacteria bacterium]|nr:TonB-dependent receptor [Gammaproteobacteria bacterium]